MIPEKLWLARPAALAYPASFKRKDEQPRKPWVAASPMSNPVMAVHSGDGRKAVQRAYDDGLLQNVLRRQLPACFMTVFLILAEANRGCLR